MYAHLLLVSIFFVGCLCRLEEEMTIATTTLRSGPVYPARRPGYCFHQPVEACPQGNCRCRKLPDNVSAVCCNVTKFLLTEGLACANIQNSKVKELHIRNASLSVFDVTESHWRQLVSLSVTDGSIGQVVGEFGRLASVSCLNLSSNSIGKFENRSLAHLYNLTVLDLSHNNLSDVPRFKMEGRITLDVSHNELLQCSHLFDALKRSELNFRHKEETSCLSAKTFHWFNSTELLLLDQVLSLHEVQKECNSNCSCEPHRFDIVPGKPPTLSVFVNCSGLNLTSLPAILPPNTIVLNISNNNITSLELINDESYENLRELYADNNEITSILPLEGTKFLNNMNALSLRHNKLKLLPTYILSNIFDRNYNFRHINLGHNRLQCDCTTAKGLKGWLLAKQKHIPDYDEIYCENLHSRVIDLDPSKLCQSQQDWTDYIYYIITAEVLLLVGLIAKVSYDYWVFKTSGYLPWPASHMPKLPCDWLCE